MNAVGRTTQRSVCRADGSEGPGGSSWRETEAVGIDIPKGIRIPLRMSSWLGAGALDAQFAGNGGDGRRTAGAAGRAGAGGGGGGGRRGRRRARGGGPARSIRPAPGTKMTRGKPLEEP